MSHDLLMTQDEYDIHIINHRLNIPRMIIIKIIDLKYMINVLLDIDI